MLVAEVLSGEDPDKDLVRNVELYFQVPSIKEYWLFDSRSELPPPHPTAASHRIQVRHNRIRSIVSDRRH